MCEKTLSTQELIPGGAPPVTTARPNADTGTRNVGPPPPSSSPVPPTSDRRRGWQRALRPDHSPDGPLKGMGQRPNAQGFDLTRDHLRTDSPEAKAVVKMMFDYDPLRWCR